MHNIHDNTTLILIYNHLSSKNSPQILKINPEYYYTHIHSAHQPYSLSHPRILLANCISLGIMVTLFPWIAHKLLSSNKDTKCASAASCKANIADPCQRYGLFVCPYWISRTRRAKGRRRSRREVEDWYCRISRRALSPLNRRFCWIEVAGEDSMVKMMLSVRLNGNVWSLKKSPVDKPLYETKAEELTAIEENSRRTLNAGTRLWQHLSMPRYCNWPERDTI